MHFLEAYINFYMTTPTFDVKTTLQRLLIVFTDKIATPANCLQFFNADWCPLSQEISFSHDIETIWVLQRTLTVTGIKDVQVSQFIENLSTQVATKGFDNNKIICDHSNTLQTSTRKTWWTLAEAIIGFYNLYQLTNSKVYYELATHHFEMVEWNFVDTRSNSEWYAYLINDGHQILQKISPTLGKASYHTCRMYTETIARLSR